MNNRQHRKQLPDKRRRMRRRRRRRRAFAGMAAAAVLLCTLFLAVKTLYPLLSERKADTDITYDGASPSLSVNLDNLYSPHAILIDLDSGKAAAARGSQDRIYPASLTKIMTALLAVEETDDLDETVTLSSRIFPKLYAQEASMAGFQPGEHVQLRDLLYGILLPSGAECCLAFAERISGSEEAFVKRMNEKAKELGMDNTHFCNSTGLHDGNHYSTVEDMAVLLTHALKNADFREAFTSSQHSTLPSNLHPDGFTFYSTMFEYMSSAKVTGGEILGGKTGYTEEAGLCLASLASINGKEYILVTAKADGTHDTEQFHILDAVNVYNQVGASSDDSQ